MHKVNNLCQSYVCARIAAACGDAEAAVQVQDLESRLQVFVRTGVLLAGAEQKN